MHKRGNQLKRYLQFETPITMVGDTILVNFKSPFKKRMYFWQSLLRICLISQYLANESVFQKAKQKTSKQNTSQGK